jgi:chromosome segregation ATPase
VSDSQSIDLKRQLQVVEQEATVLRTKTQTLEQENDKLLAEVKKMQLQVARSSLKPATANGTKDTEKMKSTIDELEKEKNELKMKLKMLTEGPVDLPLRTPKVYSDTKTKLQLKVNFI